MRKFFQTLTAVFVFALPLPGAMSAQATEKKCPRCEEWNAPQEPFRIFGNTYYVGVGGLASVLIASDQGHILLDGALPQSAPLIEQHIRSLGFRIQDVRLIVNSHTHSDHAGGIAALQRASGAVVAGSAAAARALARGEPVPEDPQYAFGRRSTEFPAVASVRIVADEEVLKVGQLAITAHMTPGHTPGGTTWTWRACEEAKCFNVVYADSLNAVSAPEYRFTQHPETLAALRRSIADVRALPCDIMISVHPEFSRMQEKFRMSQGDAGRNAFVDPQACVAYADSAAELLERRIEQEHRE